MKDIGSLFGDKEKARFARFVFALLFAAVMLTMALGTAWSTRDFIEESQVVPGRVLKLNAGGSHPQITFVTREGEEVSYPQGGYIYNMAVGQNVHVRYITGRAARSACIDKIGALWASTLTLGAMGAVALLLALTSWPRKRS
ncbi:DUF3592 domain-containing protein [Paraburkholderia tropica]|uniref:DUF3592 domain-containing protein n=1 Tax=Paraburkholderia tropica TaxID=92647 RepID=UPI0016003740|nr:DUF3592 domain-containing protein [Paraburkholderia tropica]QNB14646.1 DUF3592 domain-containing protein [Paraburkholderia tropica]